MMPPLKTTIISSDDDPVCLLFEVEEYHPTEKVAKLSWEAALDLKYHIDNKLKKMEERKRVEEAPYCYSYTDCQGKMIGGSWSKMAECNICGHSDIPY